MKKSFLYLLWVILAFVCNGCGHDSSTHTHTPIVKTYTISYTEDTAVYEFPARIKAEEETHLAFKVSGTLLKIAKEEGDFVRRGETVAYMDPRDYRTQLQAVESEYLSIISETERVIALYHDSVATALDYDKARYAQKQITAKYENARHQLSDTEIHAPFDGYVKKKLIASPAVVGAGTPVLTFISSSHPEIETHIPHSVYSRMAEISKWDISHDGIRIPVTLTGVIPAANASQLYTVHLALPQDAGHDFHVGQSVMANAYISSSAGHGIRIPSSALWYDGDNPCVWICNADSTVSKRMVVIESLHTDGTASVSGGLNMGENIVSAGVHNINEGQRVSPMVPAARTNVGGLL